MVIYVNNLWIEQFITCCFPLDFGSTMKILNLDHRLCKSNEFALKFNDDALILLRFIFFKKDDLNTFAKFKFNFLSTFSVRSIDSRHLKKKTHFSVTNVIN